jgi:hypothetical protein
LARRNQPLFFFAFFGFLEVGLSGELSLLLRSDLRGAEGDTEWACDPSGDKANLDRNLADGETDPACEPSGVKANLDLNRVDGDTDSASVPSGVKGNLDLN